jgi:ribosome assembly protein 1
MYNSLKGRLERIQSADGIKETERVLSNFDNHIETGFQLATFQGPLCSEPVEGMAYFVESVETDQEVLRKEIGQLKDFIMEKLSAFNLQLVSQSKTGCLR